MPRPAMTDLEVQRTRDGLLDAAQRLFEAGGSEAMSFRALAAEYGCSATMPYSYFDSKADLVDALRVRAYQWMREVLELAAASTDDPGEALRRLAEEYVRASLARPRLYELLYTDAGALQETDPTLVEVKLGALGVCRRVIEAAAATGTVVLRHDAETTAHLFWAAAHGLVSLALGGFLVVGRSAEQLLPVLFDTLAAGMTEGAT